MSFKHLNLLLKLSEAFFWKFTLEFSLSSISTYHLARSLTDQVFGYKAHKLFPSTTRLADGSCQGSGFYPAFLKSGDPEYADEGVDLVIGQDENVGAGQVIGTATQSPCTENHIHLLLGLMKAEDTSPDVENDTPPEVADLDVSADPSKDLEALRKTNKLFSKVKSSGKFLSGCLGKHAASQSILGGISTLIDSIGAFLSKLSIKRLKLGQIIEFWITWAW
ncbi:hypothetical protein CHS0354_035939 [Potamilus streckersoni]|uniref:Uncharacterized protein n=1 Tax=Potamilus streckersoni TaxID=2493646 RepID=A0AAE0TGV8_9BIVA|nr:hypothetical protein CHS0354_035939 [Potamilus streckersoni]